MPKPKKRTHVKRAEAAKVHREHQLNSWLEAEHACRAAANHLKLAVTAEEPADPVGRVDAALACVQAALLHLGEARGHGNAAVDVVESP